MLRPNFFSSVKIMTALILSTLLVACGASEQKKILIFSKTKGFHHSSISTGTAAITKMALSKGVAVDTTTDASWFNEEQLAGYSAVVFLSTTGDVLNNYQQADFERYIQSGGGFVGIHAAADTEYQWPWYNQLVGAYFKSHPHQQKATIQIVDKSHSSTKNLPDEWEHFDEWYNYKSIVEGLNILMNLDETSYEGGENGANHPIAWNREFEGGRMFYTGLGHTDEAYQDEQFLTHIWGGIDYVIGDNTRNLTQATSQRVPEENRFVRDVLAFNLREPMELDFLPPNKILFIERAGDLKVYDLLAEEMLDAGHLNVKRIAEDGLLGMAVDPDYRNNNWIYLFYSAQVEGKLQRLSRFVFKDNQLDITSEKIMMEFPSTHDCCHSGGSIEFDAQGNLYLSTGDNTNPFESDGFSPSDEGVGRSVWDAQKSSANTNDLRGKILRIKPEADGTYSIPPGNLFEDNDPKTRPEIYIMGLRNPFRISIDHQSGILYWGDVGPDAGEDSETRGPKGHDEINQARKPGNWGWPYTRGNNKPYWDYDFAAKKPLKPFDPANLINDSPNNTGIQQLPPAQESFIWYGYDASEEFPWLGVGGRTAMAGPVFNKESYTGQGGFPDYFDGKLLIYEWMRDWMFLITMDENYDFVKAEPFLPDEEFHNPMDMVFGEDGNLYVLEYGESWNTQNIDAQLNRISFISGNRAPIANITADKSVGAAPLTVNFSAAGSVDLEGDQLKYLWSIDNSDQSSTEEEPVFTFSQEGTYEVTLLVRDSKGLTDQTTQSIVIGNEAPSISVDFSSQNTFYNAKGELGYKVKVADAEDGSLEDGGIDSGSVEITLDFVADIALWERDEQEQGHKIEIISTGRKLLDNADCKACHAIDKKINGPSYAQIATRYDEGHTDYLKNKIKNGGAGVWGETPMAAHPQLEDNELAEIVKYILSLKKKKNLLPVEGNLKFDQHKSDELSGMYILNVSYSDRGNKDAASLSASNQYRLRSSRLQAVSANDGHEGNTTWTALGENIVGNITDGHFLVFDDVIFDGLQSVTFRGVYNEGYEYGGEVEIRRTDRNGELLGSKVIRHLEKKQSLRDDLIRLNQGKGKGKLYVYFKNVGDKEKFVANAHSLLLNYSERIK